MTDQWFYSKLGRKLGPFTLAELEEHARSGRLLPTDMVQPMGVQRWVPAAAVPGLFRPHKAPVPAASAPAAPPPMPEWVKQMMEAPPEPEGPAGAVAPAVPVAMPEWVKQMMDVPAPAEAPAAETSPEEAAEADAFPPLVAVDEPPEPEAPVAAPRPAPTPTIKPPLRPPSGHRKGLWIVVGTTVLLAAAGGLAYFFPRSDDQAPDTAPTPTSTPAPVEPAVPTPDFAGVDYNLPDFDKLDYTHGPQGQPLKKRESFEGGLKIKEEGLIDIAGRFIPHGVRQVFAVPPPGKGQEQLVEEEHYFIGKLHGPLRRWIGKTKVHESFAAHGERHGKSEDWWPNGQKREESWFFRGKRHGTRLTWHESGKPRGKATYVNGELHGLYTEQDAQGMVLLKVPFFSGMPRIDRRTLTREQLVALLELVADLVLSVTEHNYNFDARASERDPKARFFKIFGAPDEITTPDPRSPAWEDWRYRCADRDVIVHAAVNSTRESVYVRGMRTQ